MEKTRPGGGREKNRRFHCKMTEESRGKTMPKVSKKETKRDTRRKKKGCPERKIKPSQPETRN